MINPHRIAANLCLFSYHGGIFHSHHHNNDQKRYTSLETGYELITRYMTVFYCGSTVIVNLRVTQSKKIG